MANRFTRWAPTQYVPLPIDYYQSALAYKEQKTQESLDKIDAILAGYGSIEPISKDPQALYEQTNEKVRQGVLDLAKQNLDTPAAQRAVSKIINDPGTVDAYDKVLTDALYGAEARKNLQEYLKKNPEVNAAEYLSRFARLDLEKGDPTKFDPNRFKNMPVLSDYYDLNKRIEEGIGRLHADSKAMQTIFNDKSGVEYYVNGKITGLGEQKIRKYVISQLQNDPLAKAQMAKNIQYSGYQMNPYDINEGVNQLGTAYRDALNKSETELGKGLSDLYGDMKEPAIQEKRKKDPAFRDKEAMLLNNIAGLKAYKVTDPLTNKQDWADPRTLAAMQERDNMLRGFDSFAWQETEEGKKYSPWWIARQTAALNHSYRVAEHKMKQDDLTKMIANAMSFRMGPRTQTDITPEGWNDYVQQKIPELKGIVLGRNGEFTPENYKKDLIEVRKGEFYLPSDVDVTAESGTGFTSGGGGASPTLKYHLKPGAKPVSNTAEGAKKMYEEGKTKIQNYLNRYGMGGNYDLSNDADTKRAVQDIIHFNQSTESLYTPIVTDPTSTSATRISRIKENLNVSNMYELTRSGDLTKITNTGDVSSARKAVREHLEKDKGAAVQIMPVSKSGRTYDVVSVGDKQYYIESAPEDQNTFAGANAVVGQMIAPGDAVRPLGDGLFMKFMGPNGQPLTGVIAGGNTPQAQATFKATWDANVKKVMDAGNLSRDQAESTLMNTMRVDGQPHTILLGNNKSVFIDAPVTKYKGSGGKDIYYTFGNSKQYPLLGVEDVIRSSIRQSQSTLSPQRMYDMFPFLRAATKEGTLGVGDDFSILDVLSQTDQD
jgi:hypothetical protein